MATGFLQPTAGTAYINGLDIQRDTVKIRESLGLCPQENLLFDTMTVEEHLTFFSTVQRKNFLLLEKGVLRYDVLLSTSNRFSTMSILLSVCICVHVFVHSIILHFLLFNFCLYVIVPLCNSVM